MPFDPSIPYYIIPWGSTFVQRPPQPNGRCIQKTIEQGVLMGMPPDDSPLQKWTFANQRDFNIVLSFENSGWVLTHHSLDNNNGIFEGPITLSMRSSLVSRWQLWRIVKAAEYYRNNQFPEDVFLFLTNSTINDHDGQHQSCMSVNEHVFSRPQHLLEWKLKTMDQELQERNQSFIIRPAQ